MPNFIGFISYVLISTFTPGPNNIFSMINASRVGLKKGIVFNYGIFTGFVALMLMCALFGRFLTDQLPVITPYLKYVGAAYILWLAYKTYKSDYRDLDEAEQSAYGFKEGVMLQFVNVKVIIYGITTFTTFIIPFYKLLVQVAFAVILASISLLSTLSWSLFGSAFHNFLKSYRKQVNLVLTLMLIYTAFTILC